MNESYPLAARRPDRRRTCTIAAILAAIPGTKQQIIERTGLSRDTVYEVMKDLHRGANRQVRISRWLPHPVKGPSIAIFAIGTAEDARDNLRRMTIKESQDRYLSKVRGTERHDKLKAKWRARWWLRKASNTPATWLSALGVV